MYSIRERSYDRLKGYNSELELIHRYYLPKEYRNRITLQDIHAIKSEFASFQFKSQKKLHNDKLLNGFLGMFEDGLAIEYSLENMLKFMSSHDAKICAKAIAQYDYDRYIKDDLSDEEIENILELNSRLRELKKEIYEESRNIHNKLVAEGWNIDDKDFEIELELSFYIGEDDPCFDDDDDNIIVVIKDNLKCDIKDIIEEDELDFNDKRNSKHPVYSVPHCWYFHEIEDHHDIPLKYIAKICHHRLKGAPKPPFERAPEHHVKGVVRSGDLMSPQLTGRA